MISFTNILLAFVPALCWGSIGLVSGKLGGTPQQKTLGMAIGALIFTAGSTLIHGDAVSSLYSATVCTVGILSGFFWTIGQILQFSAMKHIGISKALPISTAGQLLMNALIGAFIFHEWQSLEHRVTGFTALIILTIGSTLSAMKDHSQENSSTIDLQTKDNWKKGAFALVISTLGFLGYTTIIAASGVDTKAMILPQSVGMLIGAALFSANRTMITKPVFKNNLTGIIWGIGNLCMFLSTARLGLAISFSLSQTGIVISTFGSIFLLGETKTKREMIFIVMGCILVIAGGMLLGSMKI